MLRGFLARGAIGLVTTHDLACTGGGSARASGDPVCFEDHLEGDRLVFDYLMRPGIITEEQRWR